MNDDRLEHERASAVFLAARRLPPREREAFVRGECDGDEGLRSRVRLMLQKDARSASPLDSPVIGDETRDGAMTMLERDERPLRRVGRYEIVRLIASGGMGSVYEARQERPSRIVALKMIRRGVATRAVLRRFEHESQILARLRHPNIAQVYEAGVHDDGEGGSPYFAMEYIADAQPITEYAQSRDLTTRQRLDLFRQVCEAVAHGHQKGVIHRDLKPGNVLVDSTGLVKVIDFGVARAIDSDIAVTTMQTDVGQLLGTLQYMSPEQAEADPHDLDVRSDVYSLGVVLYELLTNELPYDVSRARVYEAARIIHEQPPVRPSSTNRALRGDLETIVLKALEKDRSRRYQSVADLSADLERFTNNQPITARPPSVAYQLRTFARRNKTLVSGVAATFIALAAGLVATSAAMLDARAQADRAEAEAAKAQQAEAAAEKRAADLEKVASFQNSIFGNIDPDTMGSLLRFEQRSQIGKALRKRLVEDHNGGLRPLTEDEIESTIAQFEQVAALSNPIDLARHMIHEAMLRPALVTIERQFADEPALKARLRWTIAWAYQQISMIETAERLLEEVIALHKEIYDGDHPEVALALEAYGWQQGIRGEYAEAEQTLRGVLEMRRRLHGDEHPLVAVSVRQLAWLMRRMDRLAEAEQLDHEAIELCRRLGATRELVSSLIGLGASRFYRGDRAGGEAAYLEALHIARQELEDEDDGVLTALVELSHFYADTGRWQTAEPYSAELLQRSIRRYGEDHGQTAHALFAHGKVLRHKGELDEAERLLRESQALFVRDEGDRSARVGWVVQQIAHVLDAKGDIPGAIVAFREALEIRRGAEGDTHRGVASLQRTLGVLLRGQGEYDEAEQIHRAVLETRRSRSERPDHLLHALNSLAVTLIVKREYLEAEALLQEALAVTREVHGEEHETYAMVLGNLGEAVAMQGRIEDGESMLRTTIAIYERLFGGEHRRVAHAVHVLATVLSVKGEFEAAEDLLRRALVIRRRELPEADPATLDSLLEFASVLHRRSAYAAAAEAALECYAGRATRFGPAHMFTREAAERLAAIYDAWHAAEPDAGHDLKAAEWREKLDAFEAS